MLRFDKPQQNPEGCLAVEKSQKKHMFQSIFDDFLLGDSIRMLSNRLFDMSGKAIGTARLGVKREWH